MSERKQTPSLGGRLMVVSRSIGMLMGVGFMAHRGTEALRLHSRRARSEQDFQNKLDIIETNKVSGRLPEASLGTLEDAIKLGLTQEFSGPLMGWLENTSAVYCPYDKHILICGLSGSGKGVSLLQPFCIMFGMGGEPESFVCFDVKDAENSWVTAEGAKETYDVDPIFVNPWHMHGRKNTRVNFLCILNIKARKGLPTVDKAKAIIRMVFGDPNKKGANAWIQKAAMLLSTALAVHWAECEPEKNKPASFADFAALSQIEVTTELEKLKESKAGAGFVAQAIKKILNTYGAYEGIDNAEQAAWVLDDMAEAWELYTPGSELRAATDDTDFDFSILKQRPTPVYIMIPDTYLDSHSSYVALLLDYIIEIIAAAPGSIRTNLIIDEFPSIKRANSVLKALRVYREKLVRLIIAVQDRNGFSQYKEDGGYKPFEENSISLWWGVPPDHAKDIQEIAGYKTELVPSYNASLGLSADGGGLGAQEVKTPILPVAEISQIADGKAILYIPGKKVFVIERKPWWEIDRWNLKKLIRDKRKFPPPHFEG